MFHRCSCRSLLIIVPDSACGHCLHAENFFIPAAGLQRRAPGLYRLAASLHILPAGMKNRAGMTAKNIPSENKKCTFIKKKLPKLLPVSKKAVPLHSQSREMATNNKMVR